MLTADSGFVSLERIMAEQPPDIRLLEQSSKLTALMDEFHDDIRSEELVVERVQRDEPPVYMAIELPTLIVIWISAPFLKRVGEELCVILEPALRRLSEKLFHREKDTAIVGSTGIQRPEEYSILFSILTEAGNCRVKFAFTTRRSKSNYVSTPRVILEFLSTFHAGRYPRRYRAIIDAINTRSRVTIAYDGDKDSLFVVD